MNVKLRTRLGRRNPRSNRRADHRDDPAANAESSSGRPIRHQILDQPPKETSSSRTCVQLGPVRSGVVPRPRSRAGSHAVAWQACHPMPVAGLLRPRRSRCSRRSVAPTPRRTLGRSSRPRCRPVACRKCLRRPPVPPPRTERDDLHQVQRNLGLGGLPTVAAPVPACSSWFHFELHAALNHHRVPVFSAAR